MPGFVKPGGLESAFGLRIIPVQLYAQALGTTRAPRFDPYWGAGRSNSGANCWVTTLLRSRIGLASMGKVP